MLFAIVLQLYIGQSTNVSSFRFCFVFLFFCVRVCLFFDVCASLIFFPLNSKKSTLLIFVVPTSYQWPSDQFCHMTWYFFSSWSHYLFFFTCFHFIVSIWILALSYLSACLIDHSVLVYFAGILLLFPVFKRCSASLLGTWTSFCLFILIFPWDV